MPFFSRVSDSYGPSKMHLISRVVDLKGNDLIYSVNFSSRVVKEIICFRVSLRCYIPLSFRSQL